MVTRSKSQPIEEPIPYKEAALQERSKKLEELKKMKLKKLLQTLQQHMFHTIH
ncbi:peptidase M24 [Sesbania bispinosa]|nr:peptidase M24 [Sesbania bispinosa]